MQGLFTYIYHILLIITFVRTIDTCSHTYRITDEAWINDCRWVFIFLLAESIGSFAFDIGYINDVLFGFGSILTLLKVTIDALVYAFLIHLIYDYLHLPHDDSPFILLGSMYAIAAFLVLLSGYRSYFSLGQSLLCVGPAFTSYRALKSQQSYSEKKESASGIDRYTCEGAGGMISMLKMIIVFMILIIIQNFIVFYLNNNIWLGLRYMVNPMDDMFAFCLALMLQKIDQNADQQAEAAAIADTLAKEIPAETNAASGERLIGEFCKSYKMTGRETEITGLILMGRTNQEISDELFISIGTVKHHIYNIYTKLEVERRSQLMRAYSEYERNHK